MPSRTLASNVPVQGPLVSPSLRVNGPKAEATCTVTFTAPSVVEAELSGSIETSPNDSAPWEVQQNFTVSGGLSKTGGVKHPIVAQGLAQYSGQYIRMEVTAVTGTWSVDSVILDW